MQIKIQIKYVLALLLIFLPTTVLAASVTLRWQANQEPDISGYNLYYGNQSRNYGLPIPAGSATSYTVDNLTEETTYYFAISAVDTSGNESGYSVEISANATFSEPATEDYQLLLSTHPDHSNAVKLSGQTVSGDVYIFLDPEAYVSQVVFSIDGSTHNTENYAPYDLGAPFDTRTLSNGTHTISARITDQNAAVQNVSVVCTVANTVTEEPDPITNPTPLQAASLQIDQPSPISEGQAIVLQGVVEGGGSNTEYQFSYRYLKKKGYKKKWKTAILRDWGESPSFTWNTLDFDGNYQLQIIARNPDDGSGWTVNDLVSISIEKNKPDSATIVTDRTSPQQEGSSIQLSASATGGTGTYEYKYMYRKKKTFSKGKWKVLRDWSGSSGAIWDTSGLNGKYDLYVGVRNAGSQLGASAGAKIKKYKITNP